MKKNLFLFLFCIVSSNLFSQTLVFKDTVLYTGTKEELYKKVSHHKIHYNNSEQTFDIKNFVKDKIEDYTGIQSN